MFEIVQSFVTLFLVYAFIKMYFFATAYLAVTNAIQNHCKMFSYRENKFDYVINTSFRPVIIQLLHPYKWTARQYLGDRFSNLFHI